MARESTFPTHDVPDRSRTVLELLKKHDPVPVPMTRLYLLVEDKRALADTFRSMEADKSIERAVVEPGDDEYDGVVALCGAEASVDGPIGVYRLPR